MKTTSLLGSKFLPSHPPYKFFTLNLLSLEGNARGLPCLPYYRFILSVTGGFQVSSLWGELDHLPRLIPNGDDVGGPYLDDYLAPYLGAESVLFRGLLFMNNYCLSGGSLQGSPLWGQPNFVVV